MCRQARDAFEKMKQNTKSASVGNFIPTHISTCCTRSAQDRPLAMSSNQQKHLGIDRGSFVGTTDMPTLKNLVMPSSNFDGSKVVLFLDKTSQKCVSIQGRFL